MLTNPPKRHVLKPPPPFSPTKRLSTPPDNKNGSQATKTTKKRQNTKRHIKSGDVWTKETKTTTLTQNDNRNGFRILSASNNKRGSRIAG